MCPPLAAVLWRHQADMMARQHPGLALECIFLTQRGTLYKGTSLGPLLRNSLERADIEVHLTTHGLRHIFNNLARQVATGQIVRAIVGHTTEAMTGHYSLVRPDETQAVQTAVIRLAQDARSATVRA